MFIVFLKSTLSLEYSLENDQSRSLSTTEIINGETGSHFNVQKAIFHATPRQITCYRIENTAEISTEPASYHPSINSR